jgi:hypothetical protein
MHKLQIYANNVIGNAIFGGTTRVYSKSVKTIGNWILVYEETGTFERAQAAPPS